MFLLKSLFRPDFATFFFHLRHCRLQHFFSFQTVHAKIPILCGVGRILKMHDAIQFLAHFRAYWVTVSQINCFSHLLMRCAKRNCVDII